MTRLAYNRQARLDYRAARGTQHRLQLERCLPALRLEVLDRKEEIRACESQLEELSSKRDEGLRVLLVNDLVNRRLGEVAGLGNQLCDRIRDSVYRGRLDDLHFATRQVPGVGAAKQQALSMWVNTMKSQFSQLLEQDFAGKAEFLHDVDAKDLALRSEIHEKSEDLQSLLATKKSALHELRRLREVSAGTYRRQLAGRHQNRLSEYALGVFAPWEKPPPWFRTLLNKYAA